MNKPLTGCTFGILGDSYSTFRGYIPKGNHGYYPNAEVDDVLRVEDTWWHILMERNHMHLLVNDSFSGATVCNHNRDGLPENASFVGRARRSFSGAVQPDYIFVFGCTNDSWLEREIGSLMFADRTQEDLNCVLPAYCDVLEYLVKQNPGTRVVSLVNTGLNPEIYAGMLSANAHYGAVTVELRDFEKQHGHPTAAGMASIAAQIEQALQE